MSRRPTPTPVGSLVGVAVLIADVVFPLALAGMFIQGWK